MTAKRDFKRRVRQRQTRTGESYVTARRHLMATHPGGGGSGHDDEADESGEPAPSGEAAGAPVPAASEALPGNATERERDPEHPGEARSGAGAVAGAATRTSVVDVPGDGRGGAPDRPSSISVIELIDVSEEAKQFSLMCRILMFPALAERVPPARVLGRLRDILLATVGDPAMALISDLALTGRKLGQRRAAAYSFPALGRFLQRARAGLGGAFADGTMLAFHVADGDGMIPTLCTLAAQDTALELSTIDDLTVRWERFAAELAASPATTTVDPTRDLQQGFIAALAPKAWSGPPLFLIHQRQRYEITRAEFVIGRDPRTSDLVIDDAMISHRHALVVRPASAYYLADLGSAGGIVYKGVRITHKRIHEGDVFDLGGHEISFTFHAE